MNSALIYILSFLVALGILITVHEFGHFWVARKLGVKVLRFSIGFGKVIWSKPSKDGEYDFVIAAIPLGGYVKMLDEREGTVAREELPRAFNNKPVASRIAIVVAGPLANLLFAIAAFWLMYLVGVPGAKPLVGTVDAQSMASAAGFQTEDLFLRVNSEPTPTWQTTQLALFNGAFEKRRLEIEVMDRDHQKQTRVIDFSTMEGTLEAQEMLPTLGINPWQPPAVLGEVTSDGAAAEAGLQAGDKILAVDGTPIRTWIDWVTYVRERPGQAILVKLDRAGTVLNVTLTPASHRQGDQTLGQVGVRVPDQYLEKISTTLQYGPVRALQEGIVKTWEMSVLMLRVMGRIVIGQAPLHYISGPLTIAEYAGASAKQGWLPFLSFLAIVSISLGVLNLLPIPLLDGGHLMYYLIEMVKGSPVPDHVQVMGQKLGIFLLLLLMSLAFYNDYARIFGA